ncbi:Tar ligand binding domain-containing protein [Halomonas binhaiensis]|uniref:Tar ligand binding domain-containing protein n=1 Tax=Halomonas binhaiensis TaxID=2562282 RepID=A0A856QWR5_9GAMM|nr:methyl-accepting chemotaxis protein [Halomonas binhaiensis]QEM84240.2 Tar ligand binding domain-containing protein [Halomonas binhaiensis]
MRWSLVLCLFATLVTILSGLGLYTSAISESSIRELNEVNVDQRTMLNRAISTQLVTQVGMRDIRARLLANDWHDKPEELKQDVTGLDKNIDDLNQLIKSFFALPTQPDQTELLSNIRTTYDTLLNDGLLPQRQRLADDNVGAFTRNAPDVQKMVDSFEQACLNFFYTATDQGTTLYRDFLAQTKLMQWCIVVVLSIAIITIIGMLWDTTVNVARPLTGLITYFGAVEKGDLSHKIPLIGNKASIPICIGRLYTSLAQMQEGLVNIVGTARSSGELIYQGSQHIASGNNDLSARTEQQAASLEETASSMEELSSTVGQNADNARQASQLAREASSSASQGGEVVNEVIETMQGIRTGSHRVADIISTIDAIAFQTNILALNASVEAARAGEHGRGFAVVAEEVRKLASRSSGAASEIRELIDASLKQVEAGSMRVDDAGRVMKEVVSSVARVSDIMDEIASASIEQSHGIQQINDAVTQMEQVTQQNAQLVQQSATASTQLEAEARRLTTTMGHFLLTEFSASSQASIASSPHSSSHSPSLSSANIPSQRETEEWEAF